MEHKETIFTPNQLMLGREVMMPFDLIMGMVGVHQHHYDPVKWVKIHSEVILKMYDLVRKNLLGTLQM